MYFLKAYVFLRRRNLNSALCKFAVHLLPKLRDAGNGEYRCQCSHKSHDESEKLDKTQKHIDCIYSLIGGSGRKICLLHRLLRLVKDMLRIDGWAGSGHWRRYWRR